MKSKWTLDALKSITPDSLILNVVSPKQFVVQSLKGRVNPF